MILGSCRPILVILILPDKQSFAGFIRKHAKSGVSSMSSRSRRTFSGALLFLVILSLPGSVWAACNPLPTALVSKIPVGVWRPDSEREWMKVGLIRFSRNVIQLGSNRYRLCFIEKLPSRGEVSLSREGVSSPSDVIVFSVNATREHAHIRTQGT